MFSELLGNFGLKREGILWSLADSVAPLLGGEPIGGGSRRERTIRARGIPVHRKTRRIVYRGYELRLLGRAEYVGTGE